jgi:hypothetical protein
MSTRSLLRLTLLLLLAGAAAYPHALPLIAILPLRVPERLGAEEAGAVAHLLEASLVKSSAYQVVERSESYQLFAQNFSAETIFDESSAVRLGKMLSAQLIVLGTLSPLDQRVLQTVGIINVATGMTLRAAYEEADTPEGIAQRAESLGLRLGGGQPQPTELPVLAPPAESAWEQFLAQKRVLEEEVQEAGRVAVRGGAGEVVGAPLRSELHEEEESTSRSIPAAAARPAPGQPPASTPVDPPLGSEEYLRLIRKLQRSKGTRAALRKIMSDVRNQEAWLYLLEEQAFRGLCDRINALISRRGGPRTAEEHYFRNYLNRGAPGTLEEMVALVKASPPERKWKLQSPRQAAFHMQGPDGIHNVKFVSPDGHFEAVYGKGGILLTEANDPINMGTYNYADPARELLKHVLYDVSPFGDWGNSAATSNSALYDDTMENALRFRENPQAQAAYDTLLGRLGGERFRVGARKHK